MPRTATVRGRGVNQGSLVAILQALVNTMTTKPTLAVNAGGAATIKTTGTNTYLLNGRPLTFGALAAQVIVGAAPLAGVVNVPANQFAMMRVEIDSAGVIGTIQGGNFLTAAEAQANPPGRSPNKCTIGYIIMNNGAAVFIPGTTALDVAGVSFFDGDPDLQNIFMPA
ncbi:MAG: hypothetical protein AUG09_03505 [Acidobacteria bacterium 13_1_20CM_2_68_7]|nr:MAG: hypothetical protein AUG09_03505 [Acidobacteria bacterium 13_1_20CM_2_68_7]